MRSIADPALETFGHFFKYETMGDVHTVLQSETLVGRNLWTKYGRVYSVFETLLLGRSAVARFGHCVRKMFRNYSCSKKRQELVNVIVC